MRLIFLFSVLFLLSACKEEAIPLTSAELQDLFATRQEVSFLRSRFTGTAEVEIDNSFFVNVPILGSDKGIWWLDGDQVCTRWAKLKQGRDVCAVIGQLSDGTYVASDPDTSARLGTFRIRN